MPADLETFLETGDLTAGPAVHAWGGPVDPRLAG
jgi:hypothetical protein